ncbi:MAG: hypothetical protein KC457_18030 [Myxococcales bacterium]|nr:hypothetical protein [Myxococcales bacterium]
MVVDTSITNTMSTSSMQSMGSGPSATPSSGRVSSLVPASSLLVLVSVVAASVKINPELPPSSPSLPRVTASAWSPCSMP